MKLSAQEEYGLRCLLQLGRNAAESGNGLTIPEISQSEGLSPAYVGKLMRVLRMGGFVESARGHAGGYSLARPSDQIVVGDVLADLGGQLFGPSFCENHSGVVQDCTHSIECSIRSLWNTVQTVVDGVLGRITLSDLLGEEKQATSEFRSTAQELLQVATWP
jgi:Rrf2 family iron-sulfur cluster assembly transcriptional regulator